jgi:5-deoxy-glucuronate isomerase
MMAAMQLQIKSPGEGAGIYPLVRRGQQLKHLSFTLIQLGEGLRRHEFESGEEELALDFYLGPVRVEVETGEGVWRAEVPGRPSVAEPHAMVFVPPKAAVRLEAGDGGARIVVAGAAGQAGTRPVMVSGEQIVRRRVGRDNWQRTVFTHIGDQVEAAHLICGETVNEPGGWSSYPPHKHDRFVERAGVAEVPMEEIYYFQIDPPQGFGFMRIYTDAEDEQEFDVALVVEHGDTVLIPRGYHPVVAGPGYRLNYSWFLAGEGRVYGAWTDDPRHAWIKDA